MMTASPSLEKLHAIWDEFRNYCSGQWITAAWTFFGATLYAEAAHAFEKARDGFGKKSQEWQDLEAWRVFAASKIPAKPARKRRTGRTENTSGDGTMGG